jgi:hypothetical protein
VASADPKYGECGRTPLAVSSPKRSSCRIFPGSRSWKSSRSCACAAASTRSVVAASSGRYGSAWKLVMRLSRPNSAMNHGRPAAGSVAPSLMSGGSRSAPRSLRLAR